MNLERLLEGLKESYILVLNDKEQALFEKYLNKDPLNQDEIEPLKESIEILKQELTQGNNLINFENLENCLNLAERLTYLRLIKRDQDNLKVKLQGIGIEFTKQKNHVYDIKLLYSDLKGHKQLMLTLPTYKTAKEINNLYRVKSQNEIDYDKSCYDDYELLELFLVDGLKDVKGVKLLSKSDLETLDIPLELVKFISLLVVADYLPFCVSVG